MVILIQSDGLCLRPIPILGQMPEVCQVPTRLVLCACVCVREGAKKNQEIPVKMPGACWTTSSLFKLSVRERLWVSGETWVTLSLQGIGEKVIRADAYRTHCQRQEIISYRAMEPWDCISQQLEEGGITCWGGGVFLHEAAIELFFPCQPVFFPLLHTTPTLSPMRAMSFCNI